jgi:hypothetical protein
MEPKVNSDLNRISADALDLASSQSSGEITTGHTIGAE